MENERKESIWRTVRRVVAPVAIAVGAALVDVGLLDASLYHAVAAVLRVLGLSGS